MKFCPNCQHLMQREISANTIMFTCGACQTKQKGSNKDLVTITGNLQFTEVQDQYKNLVQYATDDPVNQLISRDDCCDKCGRDYATQIRVGNREIVVKMCKCGQIIK